MRVIWGAFALVTVSVSVNSMAAGHQSASYKVVADVFCISRSELMVGSGKYQLSVSLGQGSACGCAAKDGSSVHQLESGYQATSEGFDTDGDSTPDSFDGDSDGDGTADAEDPRPYDTDDDSVNNLADPDDDNDGLSDLVEWEFGTSWVKGDSDQDGQNDYTEWVAGTDGNNASNLFEVSGVSVDETSRVRVEWWGVAGRTYKVLGAQELNAAEPWQDLFSTNMVLSTNVTYEDPSPPDCRFYRLIVEQTH